MSSLFKPRINIFLKRCVQVAVRRNPRSEYWHRGTVRGVAFYEDGAHADVSSCFNASFSLEK